jgi:hypothetical protein
MLAFYVATTQHLQKNLPLKSKLLENMTYLQPAFKPDPLAQERNAAVFTALPEMTTGTNCFDKLSSEWRLYQARSQLDGDDSLTTVGIDKHWSKVPKL